MKLSRLLTGIAAAAIAASMVAIPASAVAGYNEDPKYEPPTYTGGTSTSSGSSASTSDKDKDESTDAATDAAPVIVTDDAVKDAIKSGDAIEINADKATVKEDAIGAIAAQDEPVTFDAGDYTVTIDPSSIEEVKAINIAMDIDVDSDSITITPAAKGSFGMTLQVTIPAKKLADVNVKKAHLYYVDDKGNVTDLGKVKANSDGSVTVSLTHASYYVITDEDLTAETYDDDEDDAVIDDADDDDDTTVDVDVVVAPSDDANPGTGVSLVLGAAAVSAAAVALTSKKRK